ncbi:NADH:ubiquinone reductase (Na(+)-transporting) subunit C [Persicitalea jodogahamensis]|uniref:Na(+)-translocating NADH-quinone reductase subunit C n=1 Tax=Persicitalea jodogahamensis TaxID=402147 RepID=A0A8J3D8Z4_9BACT|nr:NADH:ubiquinone reductase (Na(+)-transporting) subunit C [Persicitalea jodogahamensis]GHB70362.1 Na(+)-translocating NADH-quinone reductase subunit C [Persicitalea jodogahamensis]
MHSNQYTLIYAAVLSVITAIVLAVAAEGLKPLQDENIALDTRSNILKAVRLDYTDRDKINETYDTKIQEMVVNVAGEVQEEKPVQIDLKNQVNIDPAERKLPLYIYTGEGDKKYYVIPLRGTGLWGPIWGYISLEEDFNTVYGAIFDHKSETPGLGAEIAEYPFQKQFQGKKIMEGDKFVSVNVWKTTYKSPLGQEHRVDGISGGTITSNGTDDMLENCIAPYVSYFDKINTKNQKQVAVK